jgi:lysophospholipase L1-like esterase
MLSAANPARSAARLCTVRDDIDLKDARMKKVALILAGILIPLLLAEVVLRLIGFGIVRPELRFDMVTRSGLESGRLVPDRDLFWRDPSGPPSETEQVLRLIRVGDPILPRTGKFRVIVLGDSCSRLSVRGWPYSVLLEQGLNPQRVEVFNASVPGYTTQQGLAWLRRQLLAWQADLVIVYFGWNDHWRSTGLTDRQYAAALSPGHLRLATLLSRRQEPPPLRVPLPDFRENLRAIANDVGRRGGRVLFLTAPAHLVPENVNRLRQNGYLLMGDDASSLHRDYQRAVRELGRGDGARVYDAADLFGAVSDPQTLLHRDGIHLTDVGHAVLAAVLSDEIAHDYLGDPRPLSDPGALALSVMAQQMAAAGFWAEALQRYERAVSMAPDERGPRLGLAWLLATCPADTLRDGSHALEILAPLADRGAADPQYQDVRAAVLAEAGRFPEAAAAAQQALDLLAKQGGGASTFAGGVRERQVLYESGRPYRVAPAAER